MFNSRFLFRSKTTFALAALLVFGLACDLGDAVQISFGNPTPTRTRTPRPTFTARPEFTATPEDTATPAPTETPAKTATNTRAPVVVVVRTPTKPPAAPPKPVFRFKQSTSPWQGRCDAGSSGVYEVEGRIGGPNGYIGGIHAVVLDKSGAVVGHADSTYPEYLNPEWSVSCFEPKNLVSYKIDFSVARANGPWVVRLVRSSSDLTPISVDIAIPFDPNGGRWYYDFTE